MKQIQQRDAYREWLFVPCPGTMTHVLDASFWNRIAALTCAHCGQPIGNGCGIYLYHPHQDAAHLRCTEAAEAATIAQRSNAFMIDAAAKLAHLTQEGFRALAVWEKDRLIAEVARANFS